jgi:hypothetical protein
MPLDWMPRRTPEGLDESCFFDRLWSLREWVVSSIVVWSSRTPLIRKTIEGGKKNACLRPRRGRAWPEGNAIADPDVQAMCQGSRFAAKVGVSADAFWHKVVKAIQTTAIEWLGYAFRARIWICDR